MAVRDNIFTEISAVSVENLYRMYAKPSYRNICTFVCLPLSTVRLGQEQFSTEDLTDLYKVGKSKSTCILYVKVYV